MLSIMQEIITSRDVTIVARYLAATLREETAYDILDEIGRAKSKDEFIEGLRKAMRMSNKIITKIGKEFVPGSDNIRNVVALIGDRDENLKFLTRYLASLAFARWKELETEKEGE